MDYLERSLGIDGNVLKILKALKNDGKRFTDLVSYGINRTTLVRKLNLLGSNGLIEYSKDFESGVKIYTLTPLGIKILEKLEEIEKIWEEYQKEGLPEPDRFLKKK